MQKDISRVYQHLILVAPNRDKTVKSNCLHLFNPFGSLLEIYSLLSIILLSYYVTK